MGADQGGLRRHRAPCVNGADSEDPVESPDRVLLVDLSKRFGGASARALELLKAFPPGRLGLAGLKTSPVIREGLARGLAVHAVGFHKADPNIALRLQRLIRHRGYRLLDAQNPQSKFWSLLAACSSGVPLVSTLNSWYDAEYGGRLRGSLYQTLEIGTRSLTDLFIVVSRDIQRRLLARGIPAGMVACVPNAVTVDPDRIPDRRRWLEGLCGADSGARLCCSVGRLVAAKGYPYLIEAMARLDRPDLHCLIVGDGPLRVELSERIARLGLQRRVHLLGARKREEVLQIVKAADLFVLPSLSEGIPLALLEAAALARPIVASRVGGVGEAVTHGEHAWLVEAADETALAEAIGQLLGRPDLARALGLAARQQVTRNLSPSHQIRALGEAYALAARRSRR